MRFVDDIALLAEQEEGLQKVLTGVAQVSQKMGMKINIQKTKCYFLGEANKEFHLEVEGQELEQTENLAYLKGSIAHRRGLTRMWKGELDWCWGRRGTQRI